MGFTLGLAVSALSAAPAVCVEPAPGVIVVDMAEADEPIDGFFDLSVGSDFSGRCPAPMHKRSSRPRSTSSACAMSASAAS